MVLLLLSLLVAKVVVVVEAASKAGSAAELPKIFLPRKLNSWVRGQQRGQQGRHLLPALRLLPKT
jgi:hypothetical protein